MRNVLAVILSLTVLVFIAGASYAADPAPAPAKAPEVNAADNAAVKAPAAAVKKVKRTKKQVTGKININTAGDTDFKNIPKVGSKIARKVVELRDSLGGKFTSVEQLKAVEKFPYEDIKDCLALDGTTDIAVKTVPTAPVNINTAGVDDLMSITGIDKTVSEAIIKYRKDKPFEKPEDIMDVKGVRKEIFENITDYIIVK